jgi:hypothetical protein
MLNMDDPAGEERCPYIPVLNKHWRRRGLWRVDSVCSSIFYKL